MLQLELSPLRLPTLWLYPSVALHLLRLLTKCMRMFNFCECAFKIYGIWPQANRHTYASCNVVPLVWGSPHLSTYSGCGVSRAHVYTYNTYTHCTHTHIHGLYCKLTCTHTHTHTHRQALRSLHSLQSSSGRLRRPLLSQVCDGTTGCPAR